MHKQLQAIITVLSLINSAICAAMFARTVAMIRADRKLGYFVGFDFTGDAAFEIDRFRRGTGCEIRPLTVREILDEEIARKSA